jgi:hypothetical protein
MYSVRLGAAMAMYLGECAVYTIMLIGRWPIYPQAGDGIQPKRCKENVNVSNFCHIPDIDRQIPRDDSRQCNNPNNTETRWNVGANMLHQAPLPAFSIYS